MDMERIDEKCEDTDISVIKKEIELFLDGVFLRRRDKAYEITKFGK